MKLDLFDFQHTAARATLEAVTAAFDRYRSAKVTTSIPLIAPTGAGKTVIAAAVLEALVAGSPDYDLAPVSRPVVLWFSHDPELNRQTRERLEAHSEVLNGRVKIIDSHFSAARLDPGHVYLLNAQKLSAGNHLVREKGDNTGYTIYDILDNTLADPDTNLLFVVDEAHQGQREAAAGKDSDTVVSRLINGHGKAPAMPVVLGMSATAERFEQAMRSTSERLPVKAVEVPVEEVQASGLLKDTIVLDTRGEEGRYDLSFVQLGAERLKEVTRAWQQHSRRTGDRAVIPLMVLQLPATPKPEEVAGLMDALITTYPDLHAGSFAHARQTHTEWDLGRYRVPYIAPTSVQHADDVRVLLVQEAVTTGWDCPRAEVLVSLKTAAEHTYITQLIGRLLRTPLARRIEGDDVLNAAFAVLPRFDADTLDSIVQRLEHGSVDTETGEKIPGRDVVLNPVTLTRNEHIEDCDQVVEVLETLPSYRLPGVQRHPLTRMYTLASQLAIDFPDVAPFAEVNAALCRVVDFEIETHREEFDAALHDVLHVDVHTTFVDRMTGQTRSTTRSRRANAAAVDAAYSGAKRVFPELANRYVKYLLVHDSQAPEGLEEGIRQAVATISAAASIRGIVDAVYAAARAQVTTLYEKNRARITTRPELREKYDAIRLMSDRPEPVGLSLPTSLVAGRGSSEVPVPTFAKHLLADSHGQAPVQLNAWEQTVIEAELAHDFTVGWYRNPSSSGRESLGVPWVREDGSEAILRPDFLVFSRSGDDVGVSIIDPHGTHLTDALPKLRGLSAYAKQHGHLYSRIDSIARVGETLRAIDHKDARVQEALVAEQVSVEALFQDERLSNWHSNL